MNKPLRQTTAALIARSAKDFEDTVQKIVRMALEDGEIPPGARLDITQTPPVWVVEDTADAAKE